MDIINSELKTYSVGYSVVIHADVCVEVYANNEQDAIKSAKELVDKNIILDLLDTSPDAKDLLINGVTYSIEPDVEILENRE